MQFSLFYIIFINSWNEIHLICFLKNIFQIEDLPIDKLIANILSDLFQSIDLILLGHF